MQLDYKPEHVVVYIRTIRKVGQDCPQEVATRAYAVADLAEELSSLGAPAMARAVAVGAFYALMDS